MGASDIRWCTRRPNNKNVIRDLNTWFRKCDLNVFLPCYGRCSRRADVSGGRTCIIYSHIDILQSFSTSNYFVPTFKPHGSSPKQLGNITQLEREEAVIFSVSPAAMKSLLSVFVSWVTDRSSRRHEASYQVLEDTKDDLLEMFLQTRRCHRRGAVSEVLPQDALFVKDMLRFIIVWKRVKTYDSTDEDAKDILDKLSKEVPIAYSNFFRKECKGSSLLSVEDLVTKISLIGQAVDPPLPWDKTGSCQVTN